jgi:DNA-binding response OmpR family regulator
MTVLILTADATAEAKKRALEAGAKDFVTKPFDRLEVMLRIRNLLDTRASISTSSTTIARSWRRSRCSASGPTT